MQKRSSTVVAILCVMLFLSVGAARISAQNPPARLTVRPAAPAAQAPTNEELSATREQLFKLLRLSPRLTMVLSRDPSLLADQTYVNRSNPELGRFLESHPEIARNPEFYLFANTLDNLRNRPPELAFQQQVWPELLARQSSLAPELINNFVPFLVFVCILGALLWILRVILENRRWSRIFKLQTEVHSRLLDKFATNNELLAYMGSESGKRFLESAPIPVGFGDESPMRGSMARVLIPLQLGVVLGLVGAGFLILRSYIPDVAVPFLVFGILGVMLGLGFIISAALSWGLARHLGLLPRGAGAHDKEAEALSTRGQL